MKSVSRTIKLFLLAGLLQLFSLSLFSQLTLVFQVEENYPDWVDVDVVAFGFSDLVSMQFSIGYDPDEATFDGAYGFMLPGMTASNIGNPGGPSSGFVTHSWLAIDVLNGETVPDGTVLYTLRFIPSVQGGCSFFHSPTFPVITEITDGSGLVTAQFADCGNGGGMLVIRTFADQDADCAYTTGEPLLPQLVVAVASGGDTAYVYAAANDLYYYPIQINDETLTLSLVSSNSYWEGCVPFEVVDINDPSASIEVDLGATALQDCKELAVELTTPFLRRCFQSQYHVNYCNTGTLPVPGAEVLIDFDPFLEVTGSSIPWTNANGNTYTFPVGDLEIGECGEFSVLVLVSCDAELGQTHCSQAVIRPIEFCDPAPAWDGAQLAVSGACNGDKVVFEIENVGQEAMSAQSGYIVIEDDMIKMMEPIDPLGPGSKLELEFPASGSTWRVEAAQVPGFPVPSAPSATVEACDEDGDGSFSLGFVNMYAQDEEASYVSVHCIENIGSWDPNDKTAFPAGYREEHFIEPGTRLEYLIRFQNTGTDTAFTVVIRDTLSEWLDPATLRLQGASHPYQLQVFDEGRLVITFPDILLPDSTTNEPASNGFVQFAIDQMPGNPLGELIENTAAIYFDFNVPVITNTVFHTLGVDYVQDVSSAGGRVPVIRQLEVSPNPATGPVRVSLPGVDQGMIMLYDLAGTQVGTASFHNGEAILEQGALPSGVYWIVVEQAGSIRGFGRLVWQ